MKKTWSEFSNSKFKNCEIRYNRHTNTIMTETVKVDLECIWVEFEDLLLEGVKRKSYHAVELLLQHELLIEEKTKKTGPDKCRERCPTPLIFASENGYNEFLKLFVKYDYTIPVPHITNCQCDKCQDDKLGEAISRMSILQALSNPMWIGLTSQDPFLTLFKLCQLNRLYGNQDDSFENRYEELREMNFQLCLKLLDEVESEKEGACIMRHKSYKKDIRKGADLTFISLAIDYHQKEVVSHPVSQHFVTSRVFDEIPRWKTSGLVYKMLLVFCLAILYPITTMFHVLCPFNCCSPIADISMKPFVKFINGAASFITFLILLAIMGATHREGIRIGESPCEIEVLVFIWLLGFCVGEFKQMYSRGIADYFSCGWNWIDIGMDVLMVFAYITWIVLCFHTPSFTQDLMHFSDGMFALAIILSFFRVVYLCQITSYLGLLQLCLGKMVQVIFQFAFITLVVLLSFAVAMAYLYHASAHHSVLHEKYEKQNANRSEIFKILAKNYDGLLPTLFTLAWAGFSMADTKTLDDFRDGSLIQLWVNLLFIVYFAVSMIVLLNMLIAMMNNSYEHITNNLETEHKFSRTTLWLEYIGDEQTRPVPFNLIPTYSTIKSICNGLQNICHGRIPWARRSRDPTIMNEVRKEYKELCSKLMDRYIFKKYGYSLKDEVRSPPLPDDDPFLQKVKNHFELWKSTHETECSCGGIDNLAYSGQGEQFYTSDDVDTDTPNCNGFYDTSQL